MAQPVSIAVPHHSLVVPNESSHETTPKGGSKSDPQDSIDLLNDATVISHEDVDTSAATSHSIHEPSTGDSEANSGASKVDVSDELPTETPVVQEHQTPKKKSTMASHAPTTPQEGLHTHGYHHTSSHSHTGSRGSSLMEYFLEAPSPATSEASAVRYPEIARKLFNEEFVSIQPEEYTQFLAANDEESSIIRMHYMDQFKWNANLLKSTRTLCSKLYLKGESQEIDRILSSFTKSYLKQHPKNVFQTQDFEKIYIIIYSLILLNTALHNSEVTKKSKISQSDYIRNTFSTFLQQNSKSSKPLDLKQRIMIEGELSNYYESLAKNELHLKRESKRNKQFRNSMISSHSHEYRTSNGSSVVNSIKNKPHPPLPPTSPTRKPSVRKNYPKHQNTDLHPIIPGTFPDPKESWNITPNNDSSETISNSNEHDIEKVSLGGNGGSDSTTVPDELEDHLDHIHEDDPLHPGSHVPPNLISRQMSGSSAWSSESGARRPSLQMQRFVSNQSQVSNITAASSKPRNKRVGFTRALVSDQNHFYRNGNSSRVSTAASSIRTARVNTVDPRQPQNNININDIILNSGNGHRRRTSQSSNHGAHNASQAHSHSGATGNHQVHGVLNKRASRASIISNESLVSYNDDTLSMISLDTADINLGNQYEPEQNIEEFNVDDYQDYYDLTLELQGAPYLKEGLLKLKVINNDHDDNSALGDGLNSSSVALSNGSITSANGGRFFSFFKKNGAKTGEVNTTSENLGLLPTKFTEQFVVVSKGQLSLYSFDPKVIKKYQKNLKKIKKKVNSNHLRLGGKKIDDYLDEDLNMIDDGNLGDSSTGAVGDGNWLKNAANIGVYNLCSTFSQVEKLEDTHGADSNMVLWSLTFPKVSKRKPKKFLFEAGTREIALEFVNTCNFWASKITAIPTLEESVSSIEYGWNDLDRLIRSRDLFKKLRTIEKWEPTIKGVYLSNYVVSNQSPDIKGDHFGMMKQFVKTLRYYNHLKKLYHDFIILRERFNTNFPVKKYGCSNYSKIMNNYNSKVVEYRNELKKYKHYLIILGFGLQLRFDLEEEDRLQELDQTLNSEEVHAMAAADGFSKPSVNNGDKTDNTSPTLVAEEEDDLTKLVKKEIHQLFTSLKDLDKKIPSYESSKSLQNIVELTKLKAPAPENLDINPRKEDDAPFHLVKSPKTFTFAEFQDIESPVSQLLKSGGASPVEPSSSFGDENTSSTPTKTILHSFSTNTIQEEEEPEEDELNNTTMMTMNTTTQSHATNTSKGIASTIVVVNAVEGSEEDSAQPVSQEVSTLPDTKIEKVSEIVKAKVSPSVHIVNIAPVTQK